MVQTDINCKRHAFQNKRTEKKELEEDQMFLKKIQ